VNASIFRFLDPGSSHKCPGTAVSCVRFPGPGATTYRNTDIGTTALSSSAFCAAKQFQFRSAWGVKHGAAPRSPSHSCRPSLKATADIQPRPPSGVSFGLRTKRASRTGPFAVTNGGTTLFAPSSVAIRPPAPAAPLRTPGSVACEVWAEPCSRLPRPLVKSRPPNQRGEERYVLPVTASTSTKSPAAHAREDRTSPGRALHLDCHIPDPAAQFISRLPKGRASLSKHSRISDRKLWIFLENNGTR
jgi:hypothetical protein